ncbi:MAG TPA: 6-phosphogluconolactonase [Candidatus Limnocylindrales bacterium]|nr:6-phosphogluconolactonase [Candidatus Limnocylindrales bacterium]
MTHGSTAPELIVVPDADAVATEAAARIGVTLADAVSARGRADWATTGGSLAPAIYRRLAAPPLRDTIPWPAVHVWWGDDRYVPRDHPLSNVKPLDDILLAIASTESGQLGLGMSGSPTPVPLPLENLHPFPTTAAIGGARGAAWCAAQLAAELSGAGLGRRGAWPIFDLILLGVGGDGHLLSVFPGSAAFESSELAMAIPAPTHVEPHLERVTLNPAVLGPASRVLVVVAGEGKAGILADIFGAVRDPVRWPAQLALRGGATWIVDSGAAGRLDR